MLFLREWYMHPNGQIPAYEWAFGDVNPPVHAWAAWRVYKIDKRIRGAGDRRFLERVFHKLLLNFTWWVNRKDAEGNNVFQGGFLGLDNIGVFDRSAPLPTGGHLEQSDGTAGWACTASTCSRSRSSWRRDNPAYEDMATKFFEHFVLHRPRHEPHGGAARASTCGTRRTASSTTCCTCPTASQPMKVRSLVGLVPLFAVEMLEPEDLDAAARVRAAHAVVPRQPPGPRAHLVDAAGAARTATARRLLSLVTREQRLQRVLRYMLDESEFLSPHGIRALSRYHREHPYVLHVDGQRVPRGLRAGGVDAPGSSAATRTGAGPIWFPMNYLHHRVAAEFDHFYGDELKVECPTGSGQSMALWDVAAELSRRLTRIFLRDPTAAARSTAARARSRRTRTGATSSSSTSTSTATTARGHRREPPDGLDGARGQAPAERRGHQPEPPDRLTGLVAEALPAERGIAWATRSAQHWPEYLMEAAGLGLFMISACVFGTLLEHPASPVRAGRCPTPLVRRVLMGLAMGLTAIAIIYSPWGQRSGAHMNPAVTLTFLRLGKVAPADAVFYVAGAVRSAAIAGVCDRRRRARRACVAHPVGATTSPPCPGPAGRGGVRRRGRRSRSS